MIEPIFTRRPGLTYDDLRETVSWSIPERFNMGVACADVPDSDAVALVVDDANAVRRATFGEVADLSNRLAAGLRSIGVEQGDRIAIVAPQSLETALTHIAAWKLGAVSLPLAQLFGPDALNYRLADSGAGVVVASAQSLAKVVEAARDTAVRHIVAVPTDFDEMLTSDPIDTAVVTAAEDPAYLIYTSGTTGPPKGALHAHRSLFGHLPGFELYYELAPQPGDVIWTPADWAWIGGLMDVLIPAWYYGMTVLTTTADFEPHAAADLMARHSVTLSFLPPTALKMMRAAGVSRPDLALRAVFSGGEALGIETLRWGEEHLGAQINEGYGQTEANLVAGNCASVWPVRPGSMGRAIPGHDVQVQDDRGNRLIGEEGEICVCSPDPVLMLRYWNQPEATAEKYRSGWLRTGDLGVEDEEGYLWFRSRIDDLIMSMGYRIGPGEIEESLLRHPAVAMCAVVGEPDEIRGQVPVAFVVLRSGVAPSEELAAELQGHVRDRLAAHERPRRITFVEELPRTTTGKIMRRSLRRTS